MKKITGVLFCAALSLSTVFSSFAGSWQTQSDGQIKYLNDDGSYSISAWKWIDSNQDGMAEHYCFDENGFCYRSTITPDGAAVNENGAWVVDGVIQTQPVSQSTTAATDNSASAKGAASTASSSGISASPYDGYTIIVNTGSKKYHVPGCKSVSSMKEKNKGYCSDASYLDSHGYSACKNCH